MYFGIPMVLREPIDRASACYVSAINTTSINRNNQYILRFCNLLSARRPLGHCEEIPVPSFKEVLGSEDEAITIEEEVYTEE